MDAAPPVSAKPSWSRVLATTIRLRVQRLHRAGSRPWRAPRWPGRTWSRGRSKRLLTTWRLAVVLVVLAVIAGAAVRFAETSLRAKLPPSAASSDPSRGNGEPSQVQAAVWIAHQVTSAATVACYPVMCTALLQQGVAADRLVPLRTRVGRPDRCQRDRDLPVGQQPGRRPLCACADRELWFGRHPDRGPRDRARRDGGLRVRAAGRPRRPQERRISAAQKLAYPVHRCAMPRSSGRARWTRACWRRSRRWRPSTHSASPLSVMPRPAFERCSAKQSISPGGGDGAAELVGAEALVNEQDPPFLPAYVAIGHPAADQATLSIEFDAPSPLGLLSPTLEVDRQHSAARTTVIAGALPLGWARIS